MKRSRDSECHRRLLRKDHPLRTKYARLLLLCLNVLAGCVIIPLPDQGPELKRVKVPQLEAPAIEVRHALKTPQLLDTPNYSLYEWDVDRRFVIVPSLPLGLPVGGVTDKGTYRMLVAFDVDGRVSEVVCSATEQRAKVLEALDCNVDVAAARTNVRRLAAFELTTIPGLEEIHFSWSGGTGATTHMALSPDGRFLAVADNRNQVWVVDVEQQRVSDRISGVSSGFFSLSPAGPPRVAFSDDGRLLAFVQRNAPSELRQWRQDRFIPNGGLSDNRSLAVAQFARNGLGFAGLDDDGFSWFSPGEARVSRAPAVGRAKFLSGGPAVLDPVPRSELQVAKVESKLFRPARWLAFGEDGRGIAVLDPRNDYALSEGETLVFSPDGGWLARNTCRQLELWSSPVLAKELDSPQADGSLSPGFVGFMPFTHTTREESSDCHGPVAFRPDGRYVAASSRVAVHVWSLDDVRPIAVIGPLPLGFPRWTQVEPAAPNAPSPLQVKTVSFNADNRITAVFFNYNYDIVVATWQVQGDF